MPNSSLFKAYDAEHLPVIVSLMAKASQLDTPSVLISRLKSKEFVAKNVVTVETESPGDDVRAVDDCAG